MLLKKKKKKRGGGGGGGGGTNATHSKTKQSQKPENEMFLILYLRQPVLLLLLSGLLLLFCFRFVFFFDGPPGLAGLVTHVYVAFGCENTQTRTAALTSVASEAKYTKSVFLHCSGSSLNLCLTNARVKRET